MNNKIEDKRAIRLLISNNLERSWKMIFYIFLNIFIWKNTQDIQITALFNIVYLTSHFLSFVLFSPIVKKWHNKILNSISLVGLSLVFLSIMVLWEFSLQYIYIIAAWFWIFNWIYWVNYHVVQFKLTTFKNRWNYTWLKHAFEWISKIIIPSSIWFIVTFNYSWYGYQTAFWIWIILFLWSLFIWNVNIKKQWKTRFKFKELIWKVKKNKNVFSSLYTYWLTGFSFWNTLVEVLIWIMIFKYVWDEARLWLTLSLISIVSIIAIYVFWKFISYSKYKYAIWIFWGAYIVSLLWFVSIDNFYVVLLFSSLIGTFAQFYSLPQKVISDNVLHQIKNYKEYRTEYMVLREMFLYAWWLSAFVLLYFINGIELTNLRLLFIFMAILVLISTYKLTQINLEEK